MLYLIFKWLHVVLAVVAIGANITYSVWLNRVSRNPQSLKFTLKTIKIIDDRLANPAYFLILISGLIMLFVNRLDITVPWHLLGLILYVGVVLLGLIGYSPTLREQIRIVEAEGPESANYTPLARRGTVIGIIVAILVVAIVYLMVVKPRLWE